MKALTRIQQFIAPRRHYLFPLWTLVALLASLAKIKFVRHNNFTIFRTSYLHFADQLPLYEPYPQEYNDLYLYGPTFAVLIAPLSFVPEPLAFLLWQLLLSTMLFWAIRSLPISFERKVFVAAFTLNEMVTGLMMQQWNVGIVALIILAFAFTERGKEHWATLCIALGLVTKIYGIVGLAFFPFAQNKWRFVYTFVLWLLLLAGLPLLFADSDYVLGQYLAWFEVLGAKNSNNLFAGMQNISLLGILRKWSGCAAYSDLIPIALGLLLYALPFLRFSQYRSAEFRQMILASTLLFVVLFSTGSESSSYVIAFPAIALYFAERWGRFSPLDWVLIIGAFVLSSLSPTDIFPRALREAYVIPYALKALFPSLIWLRLSYDLLTKTYPSQRPMRIVV